MQPLNYFPKTIFKEIKQPFPFENVEIIIKDLLENEISDKDIVEAFENDITVNIH